MKRLIHALLLALLTPAGLGAQETETGAVTGRVLAEDGTPISSANVALLALPDSAVATGALSDAEGRFRITDVAPGRYVVEVRSVGYAPARSGPVAVAAGRTVDVGTLRLAVDAVGLEELTVETERAPAAFSADRTIYSTDDMPAAGGGSITDLMQGIPELEVDLFDGSVTLDGATPEIHINGRPAPMEGEALYVFLEQLPADQVERIEVIPNPSARYDAAGAGGIINIVLREDVELGLSGNLYANAGTRGRSGLGARITYQKGDVTLLGGGSLRHSDYERSSYDLRQNLLAEPTTFLRQDSRSTTGGLSGGGDFTLRYTPGEETEFFLDGRVFRHGDEREGVQTTTHMDAKQQPTLRYERITESNSRRLSLDLNTGFTRTFGERGHELEARLEVETGDDRADERMETRVDEAPGAVDGLPPELTLDDESERDYEITARADYARPLGEAMSLELGYRGRLDERSTAHERRIVDPAAAGVEDLSFEHRQLFHSAYATLSRKLGPAGLQLGVRAERADTRFTLPTGQTFDNDYVNLFPSGNVSFELGRGRQLRLSYSRRIRRPSPWVMDPTDRSNDPLNRSVGNPEIEPSYTHLLRGDVRWTGSLGTLRLAPFYRRTTGDWVRITTVDADGVSTRTWQNLGVSEHYGARLTASFRDVWGMSGFVSVDGREEVRDAGELSDAYSGSSFAWSTRARISAELTSTLSAQTMVMYRPPRETVQGRAGSRVIMHMGLRQRLLDGRASVRLAVVDPFDLFEYSFETNDPTHVQVGSSEIRIRSARISVSYTFGGAEGGNDRGRRRGRGWRRR